MILAFHGVTTLTSDLETDVAITARAGFKALEVWAAKMDHYLTAHSLADRHALFMDHGVIPLTFNSIEFIAFRGDEYDQVQARLYELGKIAEVYPDPPNHYRGSQVPRRTATCSGLT